MLAMSQPLNLWAPTAAHLQRFTPNITTKQILKYVEEGYVRILGREPWLLDKNARNTPRWPETEWDSNFDGAIKKLCEEDLSLPTSDRRVLACPPESGWDWADQYLSKRPEEATRWSRLSKNRNGQPVIPLVIRARALSHGSDGFQAARQILRDAHNHGRAYAESGAEVPFLLSSTDIKYLKVIATAPSDDVKNMPEQNLLRQLNFRRPNVEVSISDIASQLVELLRMLDIHSRNAGEAKSFERFVRGEGHQMLVTWISSVCTLIRETDPRTVDDLILRLLRDDLGRAKLTSPIKSLVSHKDEAAVGLVGLASMAVGLLTDPIGAASAAGVLAQVFPLGKGLSRQLGYAPSDFTGEQWPFLYTYGRRATRKSLKRIRQLLEDLR